MVEKTAIFTPYDMSNSEEILHKHAGERVTVVREVELDHDEFRMFVTRAQDGTVIQAFEDELSDITEGELS